MINVVKFRSNRRAICPGMCLAVPSIDVPIAWFHQKMPSKEEYITCSATIGMFADITKIEHLLEAVFWRRLQECNEYRISNIPIAYHARQKVSAVLIWIGSVSQASSIMSQISVLSRAPMKGPKAVIGWAALDDIYNCQSGSDYCKKSNQWGTYMSYMPGTAISMNHTMGFGWACAQRRPLRALAHVLLLYEPESVFIGDDDTYLNFNLYKYLVSSMRETLFSSPIVLGHCISGRFVSPQGFLFGGTGYVLGRRLLEILSSNMMKVPTSDDKFSVQFLSLARSALRGNLAACSKRCILSDQTDEGGYIPISSRLVDLCLNLLADEHTCHHSDHSISRCLMHGAYATVIHIPASNINSSSLQPTHVQVCRPENAGRDSCKVCDTRRHLSCHRHRPVSSTNSTPVRTDHSESRINYSRL